MTPHVLYADDWLVAINKPHGLLVHRTKIANDAQEFALQQVRDHLGVHVHPIHRLDRKTSGILLFAKSTAFVSEMQTVLSQNDTSKEYLAFVRGFFQTHVELDHPLISYNGVIQQAQTDFRCIEQYEIPVPFGMHSTSRYSLIAAYPKTGRMHQIRKHLNHLRHPIIGDRPHGCNKQNRLFKERWNMTTMLLHANRFQFNHPVLKQQIRIEAPLSAEFKSVIERFEAYKIKGK